MSHSNRPPLLEYNRSVFKIMDLPLALYTTLSLCIHIDFIQVLGNPHVPIEQEFQIIQPSYLITAAAFAHAGNMAPLPEIYSTTLVVNKILVKPLCILQTRKRTQEPYHYDTMVSWLPKACLELPPAKTFTCH